jgi:hypothetical protein
LWAFSTLCTIRSINEEPKDTYYPKKNYTNLPPALTPGEDYEPFYSDNLAIETAILGCLSLVLSIINITNIFIGALILLKVSNGLDILMTMKNIHTFFITRSKKLRPYLQCHHKPDDSFRKILRLGIDYEAIYNFSSYTLLSDRERIQCRSWQKR